MNNTTATRFLVFDSNLIMNMSFAQIKQAGRSKYDVKIMSSKSSFQAYIYIVFLKKEDKNKKWTFTIEWYV